MRRIGVGAIVLGLLLFAGGFAYDAMYAGAPYQDPPPALAARHTTHREIAGWFGRAGLAMLVAGVGMLLVNAGVRWARGP